MTQYEASSVLLTQAHPDEASDLYWNTMNCELPSLAPVYWCVSDHL